MKNKCTAFRDIFSKEAVPTTVITCLKRIKDGTSKAKVEEIRTCLDKNKADLLKRSLPSICFSGEFAVREDNKIISHSGFIVLDFDKVGDIEAKKESLKQYPYVAATWVSPSGNGVKALVKIADGKKHREHFQALQDIFPDIDKSGINESRVCYESYDPNICIKESFETFTKIKTIEKVESKEVIQDEAIVFSNILKWLTNKGKYFVNGERNLFMFTLASACCRFGLPEESAIYLIQYNFSASNDFTSSEQEKAIRSAYKRNNFGSASFEKDILVDKISKKEVKIEIDPLVYDETVAPRDVIYGADVKDNALSLYDKGYEKVYGINVVEIDNLFKYKRGELSGLTGIGNHGKSTIKKWYMMMRALLYGEKFAVFVPEDNPPEEYYNDFVEILLGCNCTPYNFDGSKNAYQPSRQVYSNAYDFVSKHIFYLYPKEAVPTLDYILERFLEMIIKEKVDGCLIDPWNQVAHQYGEGGVAKYLEQALGRLSRFAQTNNVYMNVVVHPKQISEKHPDGNYKCPDVFDIADGAMWNNKLDNIVVYYRPYGTTDRNNPLCQWHSIKIRRQKIVGLKGSIDMNYLAGKRRFEVGDRDPLQDLKNKLKLDFTASSDVKRITPTVEQQPMFESTKIPQAVVEKKLAEIPKPITFNDNNITLEDAPF